MSARDVWRQIGYHVGLAIGLAAFGWGCYSKWSPAVYGGVGVALFFAYLSDPTRTKDATLFLGKTVGTYIPIVGGSRPADPPPPT